jgi:hypothetical protein
MNENEEIVTNSTNFTNSTASLIDALVAAVSAEKQFQNESNLLYEAKAVFKAATEAENIILAKHSTKKSMFIEDVIEKLRSNAMKAREMYDDIVKDIPSECVQDESGNHADLLCNAEFLEAQAATLEAQLVVKDVETRVEPTRKMYDYTCGTVLNALLAQVREDADIKKANEVRLETLLSQIAALQTRVTILEDEKT